MHQAATWLLALTTLFSHVEAFYPYHTETGGHSKRIPADAGSIRASLHRVKRNDNKFAITRSNKPATPNAVAIDQDGSDYSYLSTFQFGSKAQPMFMLIDTGSPSTWVFGTECQSDSCTLHNTYGPEDTTTLKTTTNKFSLAYGTGEVDGYSASDTVAFANFSTTMSFGIATSASDDFEAYPMDGIAGLGRGNSPVGTALMDVLINNKLISAKMIGVHLHRAADKNFDGEIIFGGIDPSKYSGQIYWTNTTSTSGWELPVDDVVMDNTPLKLTGRTAIIDTGTTFLLLPPSDAKVVHTAIPGSSPNGEGFSIPCNSNVNLQFKINGQLFAVSPRDYVGKPVSSGSSTCQSNIIGHTAFSSTQWILGDVFLKNCYSVFDYTGSRIGLAREGTGGVLPGSSSSTTSSSSSSITATASSTTSGRVSSTSSTSSARPTTTDSNLPASASRNAAVSNVLDYWKVGVSIAFAAALLSV